MTAAPDPGASSPVRDNVIGAILIGIAIFIGVVLLVQGYEEEGALVTTAETDQTTTTIETPPTTEVPPARPPAEVSVIVANGSGKTGAAGTLKTTLGGQGYATVDTADGPPVTTTVVYYAEGYQAEAKALATAIGTDPAAVRVLPAEPPVPMEAGATLLVVLGPDKA